MRKSTQFLDLEVKYRGLTDAEMDDCRGLAGPYPLWGARLEQRLAERVALELENERDEAPEWMRLDEGEVRRKLMLQMFQHRPKQFEAHQAYTQWNMAFADAVLELGLLHPGLEDLPGDVDLMTFKATVAAAIIAETVADEGKGQAQPSPPTSQQAEPDATGAAARTAQTR